ncbi:MAG: DUF5615 family PIN-like protein [Bacteroidetes bacterium]|nr:DUF5615 family PIN-like protein [Bacteroidota bacterium]
MIKLYANENFPLPVVLELRKHGFDILTVQEAGKTEQSISDEEVLKFSTERKRTLITFNRRHFIQLHNKSSNHEGIIVCNYDPNFTALANRIIDTIKNEKSLKGKLLRVNRSSAG